ncbi:GNAT family N-acetyltransferase [Streptomyces natalensis]|uniref:Acetyltransferase n=1 Tax=Streptomyces natalensis ATCC 27448 TaxID=1240678 RepID=A0A0D7CDD4_9ACTN|nr:GNAT family N-acetyltransferase [Streptomyces natalensis]KIZ14259.1 acetyltransferase [Streptomyces natalensis ATCC 27448]
MEFMARGRAEVRITHADVGKRVSVRRLTGGAAGEAAFTDAVGVLTSWNDGVLSITRRKGATVRIEESALVAAKVVPATPARRRGPAADTRELQEVAARGWPALETERLGDWTLRASGGFTRRANSVVALGDPGLPLDTALERIRQWYGERGLPALITVPTGRADAADALADALAERGWAAEAETVVRTGALAPLADTSPGSAEGNPPRIALAREPDAEWLALYHRAGGAADTTAARKVLTGGPSVWFASVPGPDGHPAAIGRVVVDGRWAGFAAIEVAPAQRRRGLATRVMAALAERALSEGASAAYLQVEADNEGARALYDGLGFADHHRYHYRRALPGSAD